MSIRVVTFEEHEDFSNLVDYLNKYLDEDENED